MKRGQLGDEMLEDEMCIYVPCLSTRCHSGDSTGLIHPCSTCHPTIFETWRLETISDSHPLWWHSYGEYQTRIYNRADISSQYFRSHNLQPTNHGIPCGICNWLLHFSSYLIRVCYALWLTLPQAWSISTPRAFCIEIWQHATACKSMMAFLNILYYSRLVLFESCFSPTHLPRMQVGRWSTRTCGWLRPVQADFQQ